MPKLQGDRPACGYIARVRVLSLYRPRVPTLRAQALQVVHAAHALAARGHEVTVLADRHDEADPDAALARYGLDRPSGLDLRIAPTAWPPGAGAWFRWRLSAWCRAPGVVLARAKRYVAGVPAGLPVVIEAHEVDSALAAERGDDPAAVLVLERAVYTRAAAVLANCEGTLERLRAAVPLPPIQRVIHNATRADRVVRRAPSAAPTVGYTGSLRAYKGLETVFRSLPGWPPGATLHLVGEAPATVPDRVVARGPVAYGALPAVLATFHALLLPLDDGLFGRAFTSPLKLWDYLATGIPIVAADLPTVRAIAGERPFYYRPGDPASLVAAVRLALGAGASPPLLRTWEQRAAEVEALLAEVAG